MDAIRWELMNEHAVASIQGKFMDFNPRKPWDAVWARMAADAEFWKVEFEIPAFRVLMNRSTVAQMVTGEAPISTFGNHQYQEPPPRTGLEGWGSGNGAAGSRGRTRAADDEPDTRSKKQKKAAAKKGTQVVAADLGRGNGKKPTPNQVVTSLRL